MYDESSYASRKFVLTCVALGLLVAATVGAALSPVLAGLLPTLIGGIIGIISVYMTGNIINRSVVMNSAVSKLSLARQEAPVILSNDPTGVTVQEDDDAEQNSAA
jgi:hypothetical protein